MLERPKSWSSPAEAAAVGLAMRKAGDLVGAATVFVAAAEQFPDHADPFHHPFFAKEAFRTMLLQGRRAEALTLREAWEKRTGKRAVWSPILLARHLVQYGTREQAVAAWRAALEVEPRHPEGLAYVAANADIPPPPPAADLVPRMSPAERDLLLATSRSRPRIVEFGCGGSTLALARNGAERIDSVESDRGWVDKLAGVPEMAHLIQTGRVGLHHADIGPVGEWGTPTDTTGIRRWPDYSSAVWSRPEARLASLVLVDGRFRVACALGASLLAQEDCLIAFHDFADRPNYHVVLEFLEPVAVAETLSVFARKPGVETGNLLRAYLKHAFLPG
ncbi:hypothetical protein STHU_30320 [Allostella humosa]|nr:hypothetical protein STHU_30320 [Stella humosa]